MITHSFTLGFACVCFIRATASAIPYRITMKLTYNHKIDTGHVCTHRHVQYVYLCHKYRYNTSEGKVDDTAYGIISDTRYLPYRSIMHACIDTIVVQYPCTAQSDTTPNASRLHGTMASCLHV
jgi:hypothetical protein